MTSTDLVLVFAALALLLLVSLAIAWIGMEVTKVYRGWVVRQMVQDEADERAAELDQWVR